MSLTRNPRLAALAGLVVVALLMLVAGRLDQLPLISADTTRYRAEFSDAGGLAPGDAVVVAGVRSGKVTDIEIGRTSVEVVFELDSDIRLGDETAAAVSSSDLLGGKTLDVQPHGRGDLDGDTIPLARTVPAFDIVDAFDGLTRTADAIDTQQVADALTTLADTFRDSPAEVRASLRGLSRFSTTIARRDGEIKSLVDRAARTSRVLANRRGNLGSLMVATSQLAEELIGRKDAVHRLLVSTHRLFKQLSGVVADNRATLGPALKHLAGVTQLLRDRDGALRETIDNLQSYIQYFTNVIGNGPWFDLILPAVPDSLEVSTE